MDRLIVSKAPVIAKRKSKPVWVKNKIIKNGFREILDHAMKVVKA